MFTFLNLHIFKFQNPFNIYIFKNFPKSINEF